MPKMILPLLVLTALLAGCATDSLELAPPAANKPWRPKTDATGRILPGVSMPEQNNHDQSFTLPGATSPIDLGHVPEIKANHDYSLLELIDLAESNNPLTAMAWNTAREVALAAGIARSAYLPRLTAAAVGGHQTYQVKLSGPSLSTNNGSQGDGVITSLSLNWLLFDFGQRDALVEAADQATVVANVSFNAAHQELIHAVSVAFYAHSAAEARVKLAEQSLKSATAVQEVANERLRQGVGTAIDTAKADHGTAQAKLNLVQSQGAAKNSYQALLTAIGISPMTKMNIEDITSRKFNVAMTTAVDNIIADALARRPDILAAYAEEKAALAASEAAEADFLPKIFVSGTGAYSNGGLYLTQIPSVGSQSSIGNFGNSGFGATVFGGITMSLYDGGTKNAVLGQTRAKAEKATLNLTQKRNLAVKEIIVAQNTLETGISTYDAASKMLKASEVTFDGALTAYKSGAGSITDVLISEIQLLQAKVTITEAHSATLSAAATLALATGSMDSVLDNRSMINQSQSNN